MPIITRNMRRRHQGSSSYDDMDDKNSDEISKAKLCTVKEEYEEPKPTRSSATMFDCKKEQHARKKKAYVRAPTSTRRHGSLHFLDPILRYSLLGLLLGFVSVTVYHALQAQKAPLIEHATDSSQAVAPRYLPYPFKQIVQHVHIKHQGQLRKAKTRQQCKSEMDGICKRLNELVKNMQDCTAKEEKICEEINKLKKSHSKESGKKMSDFQDEYKKIWKVHNGVTNEYKRLATRLEKECEDTSCRHKLYDVPYCPSM